MRRLGLAVLAACWCFGASPVAAQNGVEAGSLEACVAAAGASRVALEACKGGVAESCIEQPGGETTVGMLRCYNEEAQGWASLMDAALVRASANQARAPLLTQSQDAWRAWRDAECGYQASRYAGGSLARVLAASCVAELNADRAIALTYLERNEAM